MKKPSIKKSNTKKLNILMSIKRDLILAQTSLRPHGRLRKKKGQEKNRKLIDFLNVNIDDTFIIIIIMILI